LHKTEKIITRKFNINNIQNCEIVKISISEEKMRKKMRKIKMKIKKNI